MILGIEERDHSVLFMRLFEPGRKRPPHDAGEDHHGENENDRAEGHGASSVVDVVGLGLVVAQRRAQTLQVGDQRVFLGLAFELLRRRSDLGFGVRHAQSFHGAHLGLDLIGLGRLVLQPGVGRHDAFGHKIARLTQMQALPLVGILAADAGQIGAGTLAAPLEGMVVNRLTRHRVVAIALDLGAQRADHL